MVKAVVAGATGGIGQPLSLLLKISPLIDELVLYDAFNTPGMTADLFHIATPVKGTGYLAPNEKGENMETPEPTFTGADIVIVTAGFPRKPGMTRDDLFNKNAEVVKTIVDFVADYAPKAFLLIVSNPVNSMVPIAGEALKAKGVFNPKRLFGVTTLDVVRAKTFVAELAGIKNPQELNIPVIGGHSGHTIVPILSQAKPPVKVSMEKIKHIYGPTWVEPTLLQVEEAKDGQEEKVISEKKGSMGHANVIERIQFGGDEVVNAKAGAGSATLSMAYAGFIFAEKVLKAAKGEKGIVECTYAYLPGIPGGDVVAKATGCDYFSTPIEFGPDGAEKAINILDNLTAEEKDLVKKCTDGYTKQPAVKVIKNGVPVEGEPEVLAGLKANIQKGLNYKPAAK